MVRRLNPLILPSRPCRSRAAAAPPRMQDRADRRAEHHQLQARNNPRAVREGSVLESQGMLEGPSTEHRHLEPPARHEDTQEMGKSKEESMDRASEAAITLLLPSKRPGKLPHPSQRSPGQQLRHSSCVRPRAKIAPFSLHAPTC